MYKYQKILLWLDVFIYSLCGWHFHLAQGPSLAARIAAGALQRKTLNSATIIDSLSSDLILYLAQYILPTGI